jgi:hypothetical protein
VHQSVSDGSGIFARVLDQLLLVDGLEFDLIETRLRTHLLSQVDPIQQRLLWFCNRVFRIPRLLFDKAPLQYYNRFEIVRKVIVNSGVRYSLGLPVVAHVRATGLSLLSPQWLSADSRETYEFGLRSLMKTSGALSRTNLFT